MIVATPSPLTQLLSNGEDLMGNINQLIARFSNLLSEENTARISRTSTISTRPPARSPPSARTSAR